MKTLTAEQIVALIEAPHETSITPFVVEHAPVNEVIKALESAKRASHLRQVLCEVLGYQRAKKGVPLLIAALRDRNLNVRCTAIESLGKIGDPRAGNALMKRLTEDKNPQELAALAVALGAIHYQPAISRLIWFLEDENPNVRASVAWSLKEMRAKEALQPLKSALAHEKEPYPRHYMNEAIESITV